MILKNSASILKWSNEKLFSSIMVMSFLLLSGIAFSQDWQDLHAQGKKAYSEGKYQEAYDHFMNAQRIAPKDVDLSKDIGTAAYRKGEYDKAEEIFTRSTGSDNQSLDAQKWHNIGNSQMKQKNYNAAIESYKKALRLDPESNETRYNYAEAKRRLALQKEQEQKNQNKDKNQDKNEKDDQQNQQNNESQDDQNDDQQNNEQNKQNQNQDNQNQKQSSDKSKSNGEKREAKAMNQKAADKMLEELLKKEMDTKRKVQGYNKGEKQESKSGKKW
jgi:tetratricopeptide (TPR) repeat protein